MAAYPEDKIDTSRGWLNLKKDRVTFSKNIFLSFPLSTIEKFKGDQVLTKYMKLEDNSVLTSLKNQTNWNCALNPSCNFVDIAGTKMYLTLIQISLCKDIYIFICRYLYVCLYEYLYTHIGSHIDLSTKQFPNYVLSKKNIISKQIIWDLEKVCMR